MVAATQESYNTEERKVYLRSIRIYGHSSDGANKRRIIIIIFERWGKDLFVLMRSLLESRMTDVRLP